MESSFATLQEEEDDAIVFLYISTIRVLEGLLKWLWFGPAFNHNFFLGLQTSTHVVEQWI